MGINGSYSAVTYEVERDDMDTNEGHGGNARGGLLAWDSMRQIG